MLAGKDRGKSWRGPPEDHAKTTAVAVEKLFTIYMGASVWRVLYTQG